MLVLAVCVLALLSPLVAGRWPAGVVMGTWRWPWLIWAALATQIVIIEFGAPGALAPILHVATYVLALAFVWLNRTSLGLVVVGVGAFLNGMTIALNGGTLPARPEAVEAAGIDVDHAFVNAGVIEDPVLPWLGDVFAWPEPLPLANTFSVGDILIVAGVAIAAWTGAARIGEGPRREAHDGAGASEGTAAA
ncbi:DUF5317 domain-containing protein [Demequina sp. NBRC 110056]|uniref:DUF5317 domain-containing protein n=1 Tax=Demequina sp. NBRC 110056 TaxID=1570345 RepID=UPI000A017F72|nr:DUF5317 domain-containing protein [Demequina sp. NBRC 110056]